MPYYGGPFSEAAHWTIYQANIVANLAEANAPSMWTETGRIQICIKHDAGTTTAGEITPYLQALTTDAVYTRMTSAQMSAIAATDLILAPVDLGAPGNFKLVITNLAGAGGGPSFDLYVRDAHV